MGGTSGRRSEGEAEPAFDSREAASSGGWDADPHPLTLWRRDLVGEAGEASGSRVSKTAGGPVTATRRYGGYRR